MAYSWDEFNSLIQTAFGYFNDAFIDMQTCITYLGMVATHLSASEVPEAGADLTSAKNYLNNANNHLGNGVSCAYFKLRSCLNYVNDNWPASITWQQIIAAWAYNEYEGAVATVYVIDKMYKEAWDRPFFTERAVTPYPPQT